MILFPDLAAMEVRAAEGPAIAEWIAGEIDAGRARAGHVAVLLRTLAHAHHYTDALRARGIDFVIEGEKRFHAAPEVVDTTNLLRVIADPMDRMALAGLLRSPLGAVADRDLVALRDAGALDVFARRQVPLHLAAVRRLYDTLLRLHEASRRVPVRDLIDATLEALPVLEVARATRRGEHAVANVRKLLDDVVSEPSRTLAAALAERRRRARDAQEERETALADDDLDAVRLLSIHKAKGLEFPVVVLPDLHREPPRPGVDPVLRDWLQGTVGFRCGRLCDRRWVEAAARYRAIEEDEAYRVLYVALTRARDTLLLTGGGRQQGLLGTILSALEAEGFELGAGGDQVLRGDGFEIRVRISDGAEESRAARVPERPGADAVDLVAERERWAERERACRRAGRSPTVSRPSQSLWRGRPGADGDGESGDGEKGDEGWGEDEGLERAGARRCGARAAARSLGARCHDVLAAMDLAHPERLALDADVGQILEPFFRSEAFREIQRADRIERELPFVITLGGTVWSGRIDVLYRLGNRWVVGDYKSGRSEDGERYATQARVYAEAARLALGLAAPPEFRLIHLRSARALPIRPS
jgi:ATP-dependent helicase/nuclease subunit A